MTDYSNEFTNQFKEKTWQKIAVSFLFILTVLVVIFGVL